LPAALAPPPRPDQFRRGERYRFADGFKRKKLDVKAQLKSRLTERDTMPVNG
jgi:hypothetical protein